MFIVNEDNSIYATRGDIVFFSVSAEDIVTGVKHTFQAGDVLRIKIYGKKDAENVVLQKDFPVMNNTSEVEIYLTEEDTKIGDVISKATDYWYEVELNPDEAPQTIIGYDEDGAKIFKLFPEGDDIAEYEPDPEDFPVVDEELDLTSPRPVANMAIARAYKNLEMAYETCFEAVAKRYVTPEMYGAVGDGLADDTFAILAACNNETGSPVLFAPKTYIINIIPRDGAQNCFFDNPTATTFIGVKGKTILKLGDKDNCNLVDGKGFESIFRFTRSDKEIVFDGLTFDFNYDNNIIHHKSWQVGTVEENIQQIAIAAYYVKSLRVSDCTFIGHSGTNVICYRANKDLDFGRCIVEKCSFLSLGKRSVYNGLDAYHDHSTLSIHCDNTGNHDFEFVARVEDNYFLGVGGNAFNACECVASNFIFNKNIIENYAMGVQPVSDYENTEVYICDNTFKRVGCAVAVNCNHIDNVRTDGECAFGLISIHDNTILIDAIRTFSTPTYESFNTAVGNYYKGNWIGVVQGINSIKKSINILSVKTNNILFEDVSGLSDELFGSGNYYNGCLVNFSHVSGADIFANTIVVENNRIENLPSKLISMIPYSSIKEIIVRNNEIINPFRRKMAQAYINGGLFGITGTLKKLNLLDSSNNYIDYAYTNDFYGAVFLTTSITNLDGNAVLKLADNVCLKPYYGLLHETGTTSPFKYKLVRETYLA